MEIYEPRRTPMKVVGVVLVILSCSAFGVNMAGKLRERAKFLHSLVRGLTILRNELCSSLITVGEALKLLSDKDRGPAYEFFAQCRLNFETVPFKTAWTAAALSGSRWGMDSEECGILAGLGDVIGRYDAEKQKELIDKVSEYFAERARFADEENRRQYKLRTALGVGSGLMLAVLLL